MLLLNKAVVAEFLAGKRIEVRELVFFRLGLDLG
jgi:hypothetical protein